MIQIKTLFDGWKTVTKSRALTYAKGLYKGIMTMSDDEKVEYINSKILKGISFTKKELE